MGLTAALDFLVITFFFISSSFLRFILKLQNDLPDRLNKFRRKKFRLTHA